jgi:hypothetical protein
MIFVQLLCALLLLLTPWFPIDEWPCSSEGFADARAHLKTNCTADTDCQTITSYALYVHSTCSENTCVYSAKKACHTPINSAAFHRVMVIAYLACSPLHIGIVATLFGRKLLLWKGSRLVGAGTVLVMLLQQTQLALDWFGLSLGTRLPFCDVDWAGLVCNEEGFTKIYFNLMSLLGFVLLCVFGRIAVWVSKRRNELPADHF